MEPTDAQKDAVQKVVGRLELAEKAVHRRARQRWDHSYALWRSYQDFKGEMRGRTDRRDRDQGMQAATREWGATLFIPYVYATIETILPRLLSNRPRMLVLPRNKRSEDNVVHVKNMVDAQQERTRYETKLQTTAKTGLINGIGIQKSLWLKQTGKKIVVEPRTIRLPGMSPYVEREVEETLVDDPDAQNVSPYDFFWQPTATGMDNCRWVIHRIWLDRAGVLERLRSGTWAETEIEPDELRSAGSPQRYQESVASRRKIDLGGQGSATSPGDDVHEVLEFHNREQVLTVLDRKWLVARGSNPLPHGRLPFHIYRPTEVTDSFLGISEAEAIEDLQIEMNTLRTQRRDNATLKLMQAYAYQDGAVDPNDVKIGAGSLVPVRGEPRDLLVPLTVGDIPNSGYQEEAALKGDIERTSGISDIVQGSPGTGGGATETATGAQLVLAGANARIQLKTRRLELEVIKEQTADFVFMSQRRYLENREIRVPYVPKPGEPDRRWAWVELRPEEIAGEFEFEVEGGSTAPENTPQDRQDGMFLMNMVLPQPGINRQKVLIRALELNGVKRPEEYLDADQSMPSQVLDVLMQHLVDEGMPPDQAKATIQASLEEATAMAQQAEQQGPIEAPPPDEQQAPAGDQVRADPQRPLAEAR